MVFLHVLSNVSPLWGQQQTTFFSRASQSPLVMPENLMSNNPFSWAEAGDLAGFFYGLVLSLLASQAGTVWRDNMGGSFLRRGTRL